MKPLDYSPRSQFKIPSLLGISVKPKRLGDFAQAKYDERNENVPRGPGYEGRRFTMKIENEVLCEVNAK